MGGVSKDLERMLGDPKAAIRSMLLPLIVSYLVVQINLFADTSWCSGLGADASSAVSTISPIYWIVSGLGTGLGIGAATAIARYLGRGEKHNADRIASQTVVLSVIIGMVSTPVLFLIVDPAVRMMGAEDIMQSCRDYIYPQILAGAVIILDGTVSGVIRAEGAAKRSMVVLLVSAAVNMVLDPIFIYVLDLGLTGAGIATAVASTASAALGLWWYARGRLYLTMSFDDMRPRMADLKEILYVGIPRGTESMLISVMSMVQRIFVIACGGTSAAMFYNIPWRFVSLTEVISQAVGSALIPVCSANLGRGDFAKAEQGYRYSYTVTMVVMIAIAAVIFVFADWIIIPFTYSESMAALRPEFVHVLRIYALLIPFMGLIDIGSSILQSLRMAQISMFSSFARNILIVVLLFFASSVSLDAIYWSLVASEVFGGALMVWLARSGLKHYRRGRERPDPAS